jgi:hypothetical protein
MDEFEELEHECPACAHTAISASSYVPKDHCHHRRTPGDPMAPKRKKRPSGFAH